MKSLYRTSTPGSRICGVVLVSCLSWAGYVPAQDEGTEIVDTMISEQVALEQAARSSQIEISRLDERAGELLKQYREAMSELETLEVYNKQMETLVASQRQEMASIERQSLEIETTSREVIPLMQSMLVTLEHFVTLDMPFLLEERNTRVDSLKTIMGRADVSTSEKYRRILEAYSVEMDYGRTIEAYRDVMERGSEELTVDFLRLGRVALMYQSLDGELTGYWDKKRQRWIEDNSYQRSVRQGLRVAKQQSAPDLLIMPVSGPEEL